MRVLFVGDNRCRPNYGCRATSMALCDIINTYCIIDSTIYGDFTKQYDPLLYKGNVSLSKYHRVKEKMKRLLCRYVLRKEYTPKDDANFISDDVYLSLEKYNQVFQKYKPLQDLYERIKRVDALIYNAEGTFIFRKNISYELKFELFIVALAQSLNKKTFVVNGMFSDGTGFQRNLAFLPQVSQILSRCTIVTARDKISYDYYWENIGTNVIYIPDALFTWTKYINYASLAKSFPMASLYFPDYQYGACILVPDSYVVVSSGSRNFVGDEDKYIAQYSKLVVALKKEYNVIIVQSCSSEAYLKKVAEITNTILIDNRVNIFYALSILANAQCYISGRWHPSILASIGGTPCVMFKSNSHKTRAIYEEMGYNADKTEYDNPPSDTDIEKVISQVSYTIENVSRNKIIKKVKELNTLVIQGYKEIFTKEAH